MPHRWTKNDDILAFYLYHIVRFCLLAFLTRVR